MRKHETTSEISTWGPGTDRRDHSLLTRPKLRETEIEKAQVLSLDEVIRADDGGESAGSDRRERDVASNANANIKDRGRCVELRSN